MTTSVSIPFIAGQWSLPPGPGPAIRRARVSIPFIAGQWSLPERARRLQNQLEVSIPFIAGQWSLRAQARARAEVEASSQSPSLRGSGRFP